ncbi:hypothetical protein J1N35_017548 [Gossypium stocksii]|uniref:Uncharacterized protein n=1 Tax=Gossypium stocksii TaxID=47602 RepID=A0A9D3VMB2_9ROSI|nr:hypothetical protein J1N35_017548 [Gossypium stocksii]
MKVVAAYLLAVLGGNASPSADDLKNILASVGADAEEESLQLLLSEVKGKDITELIASGREKLASVPSGGGVAVAASAPGAAAAAAPAAAETKKEEKVEEKEESDDVLTLKHYFFFFFFHLFLLQSWPGVLLLSQFTNAFLS